MGWFRECTAGFAKYLLIIFNFLILLAACLLIGLSVKYKISNAGIDVMSISTTTLAVGVIVALIAFFGCCGVAKQNSCMITTYAAICILLFIIQLILGILAFVSIKNSNKELQKVVNKSLDEYYSNYTTNKEYTDIVDAIQRDFQCCGRMNDDPLVRNGTNNLISSCCPSKAIQCTTKEAFKDHCYAKMADYITGSIKNIGIIAFIFCVVELLAALFACYVRKTGN